MIAKRASARPARDRACGPRAGRDTRPSAIALAASIALGLAGCPARDATAPDRAASPPESAKTARLLRAIRGDGSPGSAGWPRGQIGGETRPVLREPGSVVLRFDEAVRLDDVLEVETQLPPSLQRRTGLLLEYRLSLRDPKAPAEGLGQLGTGARIAVETPPVARIAAEGVGESIATRIAIPALHRGREGLLSVIAHPLPDAERVRDEIGPFDLPDASPLRLEFGLGVAPPAWAAGFPPVVFRVFARADGDAGETLLDERRVDPVQVPRDRAFVDASIDVAAFAGRRVAFVFEASAETDAPGVAYERSLPLVASPEIVIGPPRDAGRPNLIMISLDTLRARSVGLYGHVRDTMPSLARRLAAKGAFVRAVVTPVPYTPPGHMTMLTGLEPCAHGVMDRHGVLSPDRLTLAERLRAAGYRTAAFTEDAYVVAGAGFERGFERYTEFRSEESASPGFVADTFGAAAQWLRARVREPFFLFVHTYEVHDPYTPPRGYRSLFAEDVDVGQPASRSEDLRRYEQEARYTDDVLGDLLDTVEAQGLAGNTVVVVTSDHGEAFEEHTISGHGFTLFDEELLVPLVVRAPGRVPEGLVVEAQVGLVDLAPTLLELLGVPAQEGMQGLSFADRLRGDATPVPRLPRMSRISGAERFSIRTLEYKYILMHRKKDGGLVELLYRSPSDPGEHRNLARKEPALLAEARAALADARSACEAWVAAHPARAHLELHESDRPGWFINRDEIEAKLRSLGYVE